MTRVLVLADDGNGPVAIGPVSKDESAEERGWTLLGHARAMSWSDLREGRNPQ
jgi:hypothetical protein